MLKTILLVASMSILSFCANLDDEYTSVDILNGKKIYKKCASCHGEKGMKMALGKSKNLALMESIDIQRSLFLYRDSNYGGSLKKNMKGQALVLSDQDILDVVYYIESFKKVPLEK